MKLEDIEKVKQLEEDQNLSILSKKTMQEDLLSNTTNYYLLTLEGRIIGYLAFSYLFENLDLHSLVIAKEEQGKGYATYLLHFLFQFAKEHDVSYLFLEVRSSNQKAIRLYEKLGFTFLSTRKHYYRNPIEDAFVYQKDLKKT